MSLRSESGRPPERALAEFANSVRSRAPKAIYGTAVMLKNAIQTKLSQPGLGRYYAKMAQTAGEMGPHTSAQSDAHRRRRAKNRRLNATRLAFARNLNSGSIKFGDIKRKNIITGLHRASKPGDPPSQDTGTLKRSAFIERIEHGVRVGVAVAYAPALEFGTTQAGKSRKVVILPRPFMRPALASVRSALGPVFVHSLSVSRGSGA
jgi:phage gpG-like protein